MSLFEELKRRRVFRLIAAYVVVAWVIIQVVTAIEEPLNLPSWFDTAVIVLLGLGFPIAVIMSWVYDVTPEGVVREDDAEARPVRVDYGKIALGAVIVLGAFLVGTYLATNPSTPSLSGVARSDLQQFGIGVGNQFSYARNAAAEIGISPNGELIVVRGREESGTLYVRATNQLVFRPIENIGAEIGRFDISPDGQSIVYSKTGTRTIYKSAIYGGIPNEIGLPDFDVDGFSWGDDGTISMARQDGAGLMRMRDDGGSIDQITFADEDGSHKHVSQVPGSSALAFTIGDKESAFFRSDRIAFLDENGEVIKTNISGASPQISADGYLTFFRHSALWAVEFDLDSLDILGEPQPIVSDVYYRFWAHFDVSQEGSLLYRRDSARGELALAWVDRAGAEESTSLGGAIFNYPRVSPDGENVAVTVDSELGIDLWTYSLSRGTPSRWTFDEQRPTSLVWSPDGDYVYFEAGGNVDMYRVNVSGNGDIELLSDASSRQYPFSITPDGSKLFFSESFSENEALGRFGVGVLNVSENFQITYPIVSSFWDSHPSISPDGKLLAFMSNRSGDQEIYVSTFPVDGSAPVQVSTGGGWLAEWNGNGSELFYWGDESIMAVPIDTSDGLTFGDPVALFSNEPYVFDVIGNYDFDPTRDRFLLVKKPQPGSTLEEFVLIQNWQKLLEEKLQ